MRTEAPGVSKHTARLQRRKDIWGKWLQAGEGTSLDEEDPGEIWLQVSAGSLEARCPLQLDPNSGTIWAGGVPKPSTAAQNSQYRDGIAIR